MTRATYAGIFRPNSKDAFLFVLKLLSPLNQLSQLNPLAIEPINMADCNADAIEAIRTLNAKIDSLQYQLANPSSVTEARSQFAIAKYHTIIDAFHYQAIASLIILGLVVITVICGLAFAFIHLKRGLLAEGTTVELSLQNAKITSSAIGIIVLVISLAILFLYLKYVYQIDVVNTVAR